MNKKPYLAICLGLAIVGAGVLPVLVYWQLFETVPAVSPDEAKALLAETNAAVMLVDIRSPKAFAAAHIPGAVNCPFDYANARLGNLVVPTKDTKILVICNSGLTSARAVKLMRDTAFISIRHNIFNVAGGISAWNTIAGGKCIALNARHISTAEQWLAVVTAFGVKPLYMLLAFIWIVWLWRREEPDLVALRWGLLIFWLGENACSVNYLFYSGFSDFWEFLHNYGMAVGFSFMSWTLLEAVDNRLIKISPPKERCAALQLCKVCIKYTEVPCKLQQIFKLLIPAAIVVAAMPLFAEIKVVAYNADVLGSIENYSLMASSQIFENRYCPMLAILLLTASWLVMLLKKNDPVPLAKVLFAAAMGPLSFGLMRLFLSGAFVENLLWYVAWEEWTELIFIIAIGMVLWVFRQALFGKLTPAVPADAAVSGAT